MSGTILRRRDRTARPPRVEHYSSAVNNRAWKAIIGATDTPANDNINPCAVIAIAA